MKKEFANAGEWTVLNVVMLAPGQDSQLGSHILEEMQLIY